MGRRGPKGSHPSGFGHTTAKGYHRAFIGGRQRLVHNAVWEQHRGAIPDGYQVHHVNGDKQDNKIDNLALVTPTEHKRIHSPHFRRNKDEWERRCSICGKWKQASADHFYLSRDGWVLYGRCRPCHIARVVRDKQLRRMS